MQKKSFQSTPKKHTKFYEKVKRDDFKADYPRFPSIETVTELNDNDKTKFLDLTHFMHLTPHVVHYKATLLRAFQIFRTMGLRHLVVVKGNNIVVGIITRKDLAHAEDSILEKKHKPHLTTVLSSTSESDAAEEDTNLQQISHATTSPPSSFTSSSAHVTPTPDAFEAYGRALGMDFPSGFKRPQNLQKNIQSSTSDSDSD